ncbi:MAG: hypothetical protein EKK45_20860 [Curvibacter sp.]|nr:MAG: hypothetical protein EKK45_20860 [Curvibacter sp.]
MNFEAVRVFFEPISSSQLVVLERTAPATLKPLAVGLDEVGTADLAEQISAESCGVKEPRP